MKVRGSAIIFLGMVLGAGTGAVASADEIDVAGSWQVNIDCQIFATATSFLEMSEDVSTGVVTASIPPGQCGTVEVPDGIQEVATCDQTPVPATGKVIGTNFDLPPAPPPSSTFITSDSTFDPPFHFSFANCDVARILSEQRWDGTITEHSLGTATEIRGLLLNGLLDMRDATDTTCFFLPNAPEVCSFHMRRNDLPVGTNVTVAPRDGATVTFASVNAPGRGLVIPLTEGGGALPPGFQILGNGAMPIFYDVSTTASISGTITTCLAYPDSDNDGTVDGTSPPLDEDELQILHEEAGVFVDRTLSRDPVLNQICGATSTLSQLVIGSGGGATVPSLPPWAWVVLLSLLALTGAWEVRRSRERAQSAEHVMAHLKQDLPGPAV